MNEDIFYDKFSRINPGSKIPLMGALTVSKKHKTFCFHIGKTGGSSIHKALADNGYDDGVLSSRTTSIEEKSTYLKSVSENYEDYFKFTFVRNKFEQLVSLYHYDKNGGLLGNASFEDFIIHFVKDDDGLYGEWLNQYNLTHENGECVFDFIGRYEDYQNCANFIMSSVGLPENSVPRVNVTKRDRKKHFSEYYTPETEDIVRKKFKEEIEYFGFGL